MFLWGMPGGHCTPSPTGPCSVHGNLAWAGCSLCTLTAAAQMILHDYTTDKRFLAEHTRSACQTLPLCSWKHHSWVWQLHLHWGSWHTGDLPHEIRHPEAELMTTSNARLRNTWKWTHAMTFCGSALLYRTNSDPTALQQAQPGLICDM